MKANKRSIINTIWFITEVTGVFVLIQTIYYSFGHWDALQIGLFLIAIALILFAVAFLIARSKDKHNENKTSSQTFSGFQG